MSNPETHTCECGFTWKHGHSGSHQCAPYYRARIAELEAELGNVKRDYDIEFVGRLDTVAQPIASVPAQSNEQQEHVMPPVAAPISQHEAGGSVDDLAALIRQLVHSLNKARPNSDLAKRAVDYLQRKGLAGSPLRGTELASRGRAQGGNTFTSNFVYSQNESKVANNECVGAPAGTTEAQELPPLPAMVYLGGDEAFGDAVYGYTADQVREAQRAAIAAMAAPATKQGDA